VSRTFSHVIAVDDAPFERAHRGDVAVICVAYAGLRLEGVLSTKIRKNGANATTALIELVRGSRLAAHAQALLLQGGFNVVNLHELHEALGIAVLVLARRQPDLASIESGHT
jgi:endonuclease V-like protein UPF0215 family